MDYNNVKKSLINTVFTMPEAINREYIESAIVIVDAEMKTYVVINKKTYEIYDIYDDLFELFNNKTIGGVSEITGFYTFILLNGSFIGPEHEFIDLNGHPKYLYLKNKKDEWFKISARTDWKLKRLERESI